MATTIKTLGKKSTPKVSTKISNTLKNDIPFRCCKCGKIYTEQKKHFPISYSSLFLGNNNYLPICNNCIDNLFLEYSQNNDDDYFIFRKICMSFNIYYNKELADITLKNSKPQTRMTSYINKSVNQQYSNRTYYNTLLEDETEKLKVKSVDDVINGMSTQDDVKKWGFGFTEEDYIYLNEKYNCWISRHECKTMAQEEIFKKLSLLDLQILKNTLDGEKIEGLYKQYNDYLSSANIKPNQQNDTILADNNTFGTFIKKIEDTRPISEVLPEWKDVDGIKKYIMVYFLGHLCKMIGLKNKYSKLYDKEIEKYTVTPPTYEDGAENDNFDEVFGNIG